MSNKRAENRGAELAFCLGLLVFIGILFVASLDYSIASRRSPWVVMIPLAGMLVWQLIIILKGWRAAGIIEHQRREKIPSRSGRTLALAAGIVCLLGLIWLTGMIVGSGLFLLLFLHFASGERWSLSLIVSVAVPGVMYLLFQVALGITLYSGILINI